MCTWSGIRWPSSIRLSFCAAKRRRTSPRYGRSWPNRAFRRPFGMNTTWYLHSQREWLRLSDSSIVARPSVCLAAHGSERHDGPPNMSNFCCLPGIAGGLPWFIYSFFDYCEVEKGLSDATQKSYAHYLQLFTNWLHKTNNANLLPHELTAKHVWNY